MKRLYYDFKRIFQGKTIWYLLILALLGGIYFHYLYISIDKLPLMDYWNESLGRGAAYFEYVMTENIQLKHVLELPHGLHWCPLGKIVDYVFIRQFKCDNRAYIYAGMIVTFFSIIILLKTYSIHYDLSNKVINVFGAIVCTFPIINLNQWEIMTLWCNFQFSVRIFLYLFMFFLIDNYAHNNHGRKCYRKSFIYSFVGIIIVLFVSQAYFPGYVAAISVILLIDLIVGSKNDLCVNAKRYGIIISGHVVGSIIYFVTLMPGAGTIDVSKPIATQILNYIKGLLIMLGSTLIPQKRQMQMLESCYLLGIIILCLTLIAVYLYFKKKIYRKTYFPIACLIYAFISIIVITAGRINSGINTLTSSRYVVETTVGLIGLVQIYWNCAICVLEKIWSKIMYISIVMSILGLLVWSGNIEMQTGPYRKIYAKTMIKAAQNIDQFSDEEISGLFQAPADDVRRGLDTMKKYHLGIWSDTENNIATPEFE